MSPRCLRPSRLTSEGCGAAYGPRHPAYLLLLGSKCSGLFWFMRVCVRSILSAPKQNYCCLWLPFKSWSQMVLALVLSPFSLVFSPGGEGSIVTMTVLGRLDRQDRNRRTMMSCFRCCFVFFDVFFRCWEMRNSAVPGGPEVLHFSSVSWRRSRCPMASSSWACPSRSVRFFLPAFSRAFLLVFSFLRGSGSALPFLLRPSGLSLPLRCVFPVGPLFGRSVSFPCCSLASCVSSL